MLDLFYLFFSAMLRVRNFKPTMGVCDIRYLDMFGVLGQAQEFGSAFVVCAVCYHGQVETVGIREDEGMGSTL